MHHGQRSSWSLTDTCHVFIAYLVHRCAFPAMSGDVRCGQRSGIGVDRIACLMVFVPVNGTLIAAVIEDALHVVFSHNSYDILLTQLRRSLSWAFAGCLKLATALQSTAHGGDVEGPVRRR
jgi:hypothetical protein